MGATLLPALVVQATLSADEQPRFGAILGLSVLGGLGGIVVLLLDPTARWPRPGRPALPGEVPPVVFVERGTWGQRLLAGAALCLCWLPCLGLVAGTLAVAINIHVPAWPRWVSVFSAALALVVTALTILALFVAALQN